MIEQKPKMPFTNAFIQEVFRYRTLGPLGIPHKANADTKINGYVIPKGIQVDFFQFFCEKQNVHNFSLVAIVQNFLIYIFQFISKILQQHRII